MSSRNITDSAESMSSEDYKYSAEIFVYRRSGSKYKGLTYHRFNTATEAIEFSVNRFSALRSGDLVLTVGDKRFDLGTLRTLYRDAETKGQAASSATESVAP